MSVSSQILLDRVRAATEDEYTIESEIGRGGMAAVFLARDIALERRVAIKVMLPDLANVEGFQDRFVIEARTAAHLDHPGIVTVYSVKQRAGLLFIVMKYIEGHTLDQVLRAHGVITTEMVAAIGSRVAEALHFAHTEGVIHRDVKPSNIIIDAHGRAVVTDFGIAKVMSARSITVAGSMLGTPTYMSPEQCRGLAVTAASDQYSLGVMMYEMLTGRVPFTGTLFELISAHTTDPPPPMFDGATGMDAAIEAAVMRMLEKNADDRFPSLADMVKHLNANLPRRSQSVLMQAAVAMVARDSSASSTEALRVAAELDPAAEATEVMTTPAPGLMIAPGEATLEIGVSLLMRSSLPGSPPVTDSRVVWRSEDPTIATVDAAGVVTGRSVGFTKITATRGPAFGRASLTVVAQSAVAVPETQPSDPVATPKRSRAAVRALVGGAAFLVLSAVGYAVYTGTLTKTPADGATQSSGEKRTGSTPAATIGGPPAAQLPTAAGAPAQVTTAPGTSVPGKPPAGKTEKATLPLKTDSAAAKVRADSIVARCARLKEKFALEGLTPTEMAFLKKECAQ